MAPPGKQSPVFGDQWRSICRRGAWRLWPGLCALILLVVPAQMGVRAPGGGPPPAAEPLPAIDTGWVTNADRVLATVDDHQALIAKARKSYDKFPEKRRTAELRGWMDRLDANDRELGRIESTVRPARETVRGYERERARLAELRGQILAAVRARESLQAMPEQVRRASGVRMRDLLDQIGLLGGARTAQEDVARAWGKKAVAAARTRTLQPAPDPPDLAAKVLRMTEKKKGSGTGEGGRAGPGGGNGSPAGDGDGRGRPVLTSVAGLSGGTRVLLAQENPMSKPISDVRPGGTP